MFRSSEHMSVTNFHGTHPKDITRSFCSLKDTSLLYLLKIFSGIVTSVDTCVCLHSLFSHTKRIGSCNPQGYEDGSNETKLRMLGQKAMHLGFVKALGDLVAVFSTPESLQTEKWTALPQWLCLNHQHLCPIDKTYLLIVTDFNSFKKKTHLWVSVVYPKQEAGGNSCEQSLPSSLVL